MSALVRDLLIKLAGEFNSEQRKALQKEVLATVRRFRAGVRLTRDQGHDRIGTAQS